MNSYKALSLFKMVLNTIGLEARDICSGYWRIFAKVLAIIHIKHLQYSMNSSGVINLSPLILKKHIKNNDSCKDKLEL